MTESAVNIADNVRAGRISATEVVEAALGRIAALNPELNAFVYIDEGGALEAARMIDRHVEQGHDPGPLAGIPIGVKDSEDCAGMPTTYGSLLFKNSLPVGEDSLHVARLRAAGAIPVGKTALPEFGGPDASTHSRAWGITRNPWNRDRTPGGSSGGSAAAVASGMVPLATAADSGGSIRAPAALCGLVGMRPSYGRVPCRDVSMYGCVGALATCVHDAARHLDVAKGPHARDWFSLPSDPACYEEKIDQIDLSGCRLAWSELGYPRVDPEAVALAEEAAEVLAAHASLPIHTEPLDLREALDAFGPLSSVELWMHLDEQTFELRRADLGEDTIERLKEAAQHTVPSLARARQKQVELVGRICDVFETADFLLTPSTAMRAFDAAQSIENATFDGVLPAFGPDPQLLAASLCGYPAISVPAGLTSDGLPVGLQIIGPQHEDLRVLTLARALELARPASIRRLMTR